MTDPNPHTLPDFWSNLLFIRHGESTCNEANRFAGSADSPLTDLGREQARQAAKSFKGPKPDRLFVSNLIRARETAEILFPSNELNITHEIDDRIAERHFGDFTLLNKAELQATHGILGFDNALYDPNGSIPNAEPFHVFHHRVNQFLKETVVPLLQDGVKVMVVAHKYVVELMVRIILDVPSQNGYDLRLPNSKVLSAGDAESYVKKESRFANRMRDWILLHHGFILALGGLLGLATSAAFGPINTHWLLGFGMLVAATLVSLLRVDIMQAARATCFEWEQSLLRFALIPALVATFYCFAPTHKTWITVALVFAAPSALTGLTLSRCAGGMVQPALGAILRSTLVGTITLMVIAHMVCEQNVIVPIVFVSLAGIGLPCFLAAGIRKQSPVAAANFAERHAAWSVILLATFIFLSCLQLSFQELFTTGAQAVMLSLALRILSAAVTRWSACESPDDYLSHGFPNLFLLVVIGQVLGLTELTNLAAWLLVPMFLLAPLDVWICRRFASCKPDDWTLHQYLGLESDVRQRERTSLRHNKFSSSARGVSVVRQSEPFGSSR